ncbi:hypothetical protein ES705_17231 [subsurface metagenome]
MSGYILREPVLVFYLISGLLPGYTGRIACEVGGTEHRLPYAQKRGGAFSGDSLGKDTSFCKPL